MALSNDTGLTEKSFNAFLLDMDPKVAVEQKLNVTAVAPTADKMVLTVAGPQNSNLANATKRAGRLYVARATTILNLSSAEYIPVDSISGASIGYDNGAVMLRLPRTNDDGEEMPFVKVILRAVDAK
jgi:hypothetical protein